MTAPDAGPPLAPDASPGVPASSAHAGGSLKIVGLGPGNPDYLTLAAIEALGAASDLVGYGPYVARLPLREGQMRHVSDNRVEVNRAREALDLALGGARVAIVSGGDPGIFAMAAAVFEAIETGKPEWRGLDIEVIPGISAVQAAAARLGGMIGGDFAVISLSDNLKPWDVVATRLQAAAAADFVIALYNPASKSRPDRIFDAFSLLRRMKKPETMIVFARAIGRPDETITVTTLAEADPGIVDMATLVLIGSSQSRRLARTGPDRRDWVYTRRSVPIEGVEP
jgi:precorrin-3B C17-methyltransferase